MKLFLQTVTGACSLSLSLLANADQRGTDDEIVIAQLSPISSSIASFQFTDGGGYNRPALPIEAPPKYAWGGFISQSWVKTSKGVRISGPSDSALGSVQRTEAGLFGTFQATRYVDFRLMVSSFKDGNFDDGTPQINYGLIDIHNPDSDYGIRVGVISNASGVFGEQLNVPAFRDMELAPQGLYREGYRHLNRGGRGVQAYYKLPEMGDWTVALEASRFRANVKDSDDLNYAFFGQEGLADFSDSSRINSYSIKAGNTALGLLLRYDLNVVSIDMTRGPMRGFDLRIHRLSARKYFEFGDITVEGAAFDFRRCDGKPCARPRGEPAALALMYRHYLTPTVNLIVGYDTYYLSDKDKDGHKASAASASKGVPLAPESQYARSLNLGVHWRRGAWAYKAEAHHVKGQASLSASENDPAIKAPRGYNVFILNAAYSF